MKRLQIMVNIDGSVKHCSFWNICNICRVLSARAVGRELSMARLPWHIKQHKVNITEKLYSGNCVWRSQFFNHSAPLPPGGHGTHYPTHSGPGTLSVPTPAREACAIFHWPETYRKQRSTNKPTPQSETTPSRHASVSRRPGPEPCEVAILEQL